MACRSACALVGKREEKVSLGTVSDGMLGLMKTCTKLRLSFFRYLGDRLGIPDSATIPALPDRVRQAATA